MANAMTPAEVLALPASVDLPTACRALGIGKSFGYTLAASDEFPVPILRFGRLIKVPLSGIVAALGLDERDAQAGAQAGAA